MIGIFKMIAAYRKRKAERKQRLAQKVESVIEEYNELIHEFRLIQEKKSTLSKRQRDFVELRIRHLISKGHIQVNT